MIFNKIKIKKVIFNSLKLSFQENGLLITLPFKDFLSEFSFNSVGEEKENLLEFRIKLNKKYTDFLKGFDIFFDLNENDNENFCFYFKLDKKCDLKDIKLENNSIFIPYLKEVE